MALAHRPLTLSVGILAAALLGVGCDATEDPTIEATYDLPASVRTLEVDGEVGKVSVTAEAGATKTSVVEKRTDKAKPTHSANGSTATLKYDCDSGDFDINTCRVDYEITVPARVALTIDNSAGEINLNGPLSQVDAKAAAGKIAGSGLGRGSFTVSTDAGEIDLSFASPPRSVNTTTQAGETNITLPSSGKYQIDASADIGDATVDVPNTSGAPNRVEAKADVGSITIKNG